jgi:hypothetical protein
VDEQITKLRTIVGTDLKAYDDTIKQQEIPALIPKPASEAR